MANMVINYGTFDGWAGELDSINASLLDELKEIEGYVNGLAGDWESDSAVAIREKITGMETRFQQYFGVVENYTKFLRNTAAEYRAAETTNTNQANQFI